MLNARNPARPESETHAELRTGESAASPSQLWIEPEEGAGSQEEFLARVDSYSVQTVPLDGAQAMDYSLPKPNRDFRGRLWSRISTIPPIAAPTRSFGR